MNVRYWFSSPYTVELMKQQKELAPGRLTLAEQQAHADAGCRACGGRTTCPECYGRKTLKEDCASCHGVGYCDDDYDDCEECGGLGQFDVICAVCNGSGLCPEFEKQAHGGSSE